MLRDFRFTDRIAKSIRSILRLVFPMLQQWYLQQRLGGKGQARGPRCSSVRFDQLRGSQMRFELACLLTVGR
jgi:hypothetical protein